MRIPWLIPLAFLLIACSPSRTEVFEKAQQASKKSIQSAQPTDKLSTFNGTLYGKNIGEFGGEVGFIPAHGKPYTIIPENSAGLFYLDGKVVALTGLGHLTINYGHVFVIHQDMTGKVVAVKARDLPGAPCNAVSNGRDIFFRRVSGFEKSDDAIMKPKFSCYSLGSDLTVTQTTCPNGFPEYCKP